MPPAKEIFSLAILATRATGSATLIFILSFTITSHLIPCGPGSAVGIGTGYGLDGPVIESRWGRHFPHLSRPALGPTQPPVQWAPCFSRGKERPGRDADPSPSSSEVVKKG